MNMDSIEIPMSTTGEIHLYQAIDGRTLLDSRTCKDCLQVHTTKRRIGAQVGTPAFNEREVLPNAGRVSKKSVEEHARQEYERFAGRRREYKEALGEAESIKTLEEAAKKVSRGKKIEDGTNE